MEHHFDVDIAKEYGILEAILLNHFAFWIQKNMANHQNFHDGDYWTYNTVKAYEDLFPYTTPKMLRTALQHLRDQGILKTGNYNTIPYDRTTWYALTDKGKSIVFQRAEPFALEGRSICPTGQIELPAEANPIAPQGEPIPDNNTYNYTDKEPYIDTVADAPTDPKSRKKIPPTLEDVRAYVEATGLNVDVDAFMDHYISCGWLVGKKPMKDWQAACRNWSRNSYGFSRPSTTKHGNDLADFLDKVIAGEA